MKNQAIPKKKIDVEIEMKEKLDEIYDIVKDISKSSYVSYLALGTTFLALSIAIFASDIFQGIIKPIIAFLCLGNAFSFFYQSGVYLFKYR